MDFKNYNVVDGFNTIAPAYDLANDAMTFGLHRLWRRRLCRMAAKATPRNGRILDVATGTADVLMGIARLRSDLTLVGIDPSEGMLRVGREKLKRLPLLKPGQVDLTVGDARALPYPDNSFDTVTISWGIRNVKPFAEGLREMKRVLKPGGTILILESGRPELTPVRAFYKVYAKVLPYIGSKLSGFKPAYQYYTHSVDEFPSGRNFIAEMFELGFAAARYRTLGGSIVYLYTAQKPT